MRNRYAKNARSCIELASKAKTSAVKSLLTENAARWRRLAEQDELSFADVFMPVETTAVFEKQPPTPSGSTL